jgi:hypothetical protein
LAQDLKEYTIRTEANYYVSLSWWGLKKLGFVGDKPDPEFSVWKDKLAEAGEDVKFKAPVAGGPLFKFIFQIPGYINPASVEEYKQISEACVTFIQSGSINTFRDTWPEKTMYWDKWYNKVTIDIILNSIGDKRAETINTLNIWAEYIEQIWDPYKEVYNEKMKDYPFETINESYSSSDILKAWNKVMGVDYPYNEFVVCICPENNTLASSLGPEKIVFGAKYPEHILHHTIIHESGVRYFPFDEIADRKSGAEIMLKDYDNLLRIIETEVCFRKPQMIQLEKDVFLTGMQLEDILEFRKEKEQGQTDLFDFIIQLYSEGIKVSVITESKSH